MSEKISFEIEKKLKEKMEKLKHIDWGEVIRKAIYEVIVREERRMRFRDYVRVQQAIVKTRELTRRVSGWNSVEEVRKWRK